MDFYIIRDKCTKKFIPVIRQRNKTSAALTNKGAPRLFTSLSAATNSLNWWLKGVSYAEYNLDCQTDEYETEIKTTQQWGRHADYMEIVKVRVVSCLLLDSIVAHVKGLVEDAST